MEEDTVLPGKGILDVSSDLLDEILMLPRGFTIVGASMHLNRGIVRFTVRNGSTPLIPDGVPLPRFTPILEVKHDENGTKWVRLKEIKVEH